MEDNPFELMDLIDEFLRDSLDFEVDLSEKLLCHVCGEKCSDELSLEIHLKSHGDTFMGLKCLFCSRISFTNCDMNDHLSWHLKDVLTDFDFNGDFEGDFLDVPELEGILLTKSEQNVEIRPVEGTAEDNFNRKDDEKIQEVTQCEICGKIMLKSSVGSHLRTKHSPDKPFECEKCGRTYKTRGSLKFHQDNHRNRTKSWICEKCGSSFFDGKSLRAHLRRLHGNSSKKHFCSICGKSFRTNNDMKYHREIVHMTLEKRFKCKICCLPFKGVQGLRRHEAKHRNDEIFSYKCSFCEVKFSEELSWKRHEDNCSGQMKYRCKFCPEKFTTYIRLRGHRRKVHEEKIIRRKSRKISD